MSKAPAIAEESPVQPKESAPYPKFSAGRLARYTEKDPALPLFSLSRPQGWELEEQTLQQNIWRSYGKSLKFTKDDLSIEVGVQPVGEDKSDLSKLGSPLDFANSFAKSVSRMCILISIYTYMYIYIHLYTYMIGGPQYPMCAASLFVTRTGWWHTWCRKATSHTCSCKGWKACVLWFRGFSVH